MWFFSTVRPALRVLNISHLRFVVFECEGELVLKFMVYAQQEICAVRLNAMESKVRTHQCVSSSFVFVFLALIVVLMCILMFICV